MTNITDLPKHIIKNILCMSHPNTVNEKYETLNLETFTIEMKINFIEHILKCTYNNVIETFHDIMIIEKSIKLFYINAIKYKSCLYEYIKYLFNKWLNSILNNSVKDNDLLSTYKNISKTSVEFKNYKKDTTMYIIWNHILNNCVSPYTFIHYSKKSNSIKYDINMLCFNDIEKKHYLLNYGYEKNILSSFIELFNQIFKYNLIIVLNEYDPEIYIVYFNNNWYIVNYNEMSCDLTNYKILELLRNMLKLYNDDKYSDYYIGIIKLINSYHSYHDKLLYDIYDLYPKIKYNDIDSKNIIDNCIHFNNGYYNLLTNVFKPRKKTDYITHFLKYNYIEPECINKKDYDFIEDILKNIHKDEDEYKLMMSHLMYGLKHNDKKINLIKINTLNKDKHYHTRLYTIDELMIEKTFDIYRIDETYICNEYHEDKIRLLFYYVSLNSDVKKPFTDSNHMTKIFTTRGNNKIDILNKNKYYGILQHYGDGIEYNNRHTIKDIMNNDIYKNVFFQLLVKHNKLHITNMSKQRYINFIKK